MHVEFKLIAPARVDTRELLVEPLRRELVKSEVGLFCKHCHIRMLKLAELALIVAAIN